MTVKIAKKWDKNKIGDVACVTCGDKSSEEHNEIILCDGCTVGAHMKCLGFRKVPDGDWWCSACMTKRVHRK